jgi:hypothetical protein
MTDSPPPGLEEDPVVPSVDGSKAPGAKADTANAGEAGGVAPAAGLADPASVQYPPGYADYYSYYGYGYGSTAYSASAYGPPGEVLLLPGLETCLLSCVRQ